MSITRRDVLESLAMASDAASRKTTTVKSLSTTLETDERTVEAHLKGLADCELARIQPNGQVRVTITGEELLELEPDEMIIVDPVAPVPGE